MTTSSTIASGREESPMNPDKWNVEARDLIAQISKRLADTVSNMELAAWLRTVGPQVGRLTLAAADPPALKQRVTTQELFELRATIQKLVTRSTSDVSDHLQKAIVEVMEAATAAAVVEAEERWSKERGDS